MRAVFLLLIASLGYAQTGIPGPVQILPNADGTPNALELLDEDYKFVGFISPVNVTDIVISTATAANPMVLTLASAPPPTLAIGGTITITGAMGAGCSGMNATHDITDIMGNDVEIDFDGTGCTYTGNSASFTTSFYWQLPASDGGAALCIGWTSAYVLGWNACAAAGSTPPFTDANPIMYSDADPTALLAFDLSGFTTATTRTLTPQDASYVIAGTNIAQTFSATQTMYDIDFAADNTYKVGLTNRAFEVNANRFNGAGTGLTSSTSYITTRKLELWENALGTSAGVSMLGSVNAGISSFIFNDSAGTAFFYATSASPTPFLRPGTDAVMDIGTSSHRFRDGWYSSLSGTGTRGVCATASGQLTVAGCSAGGLPVEDTTDITYKSGDVTALFRLDNSLIPTMTTRVATVPNADFIMAGTNITQTFTAVQTMGANLDAALDNTYNIGDANRFGNVNANRFNGAGTGLTASTSYITTRKLELWENALGTSASVSLLGSINAGTSSFIFQNSAGTAFFNVVSASPNPFIRPSTDAVMGVGTASQRFKEAYFSDLAGVGTRTVCATNVGLLTVTCTGGFVTSVTATSPLFSSGGGTPNITIQQATNSQNGYLTSTDWNTFNGKMTNPMTTSGDIVYGGISGTPTRLPTSSAGALITSGGAPSWSINFGSAASPFGTIYASSLRATGAFSRYIALTESFGLQLTNQAGTLLATFNNGFGTPGLFVNGYVQTSVANTYDLGSSGTPFRSLYLGTSLEGTFNLGGNMTVTGNFYNRYVGASAGISCAAVGNGWTGITSDNYIVACTNSGTRVRAQLVAY